MKREEEGVSLWNRKKGRGLWAILLFFFLATQERNGRDGGAGGLGAGGPGHGGGREEGQNDEGDEGIPFPSSPWAAVERGVLATGAGGRRQWSLWRRRWGVGVEGWRWQASCGARGRRAGTIYRRGEAVERWGIGGRARRPLMVVWSRRGVVERRCDSRRFTG